MRNMKAIVLAGSKGIGESISNDLKDICDEVVITSSKTLDTSNISQVKEFVKREEYTDILVLNTGGPPAKNFYEITEEEWLKYFNQMFYSFVYILQNLKIRDNGYIFLISSHQIKEPDPSMSLSVSYRLAFSSILKLLTPDMAKRNITNVNILPGPIGTDRLKDLVDDIDELESRLPLGRVGDVKEISSFIVSIIDNNIKYLTGVSINFDGGLNKFVL